MARLLLPPRVLIQIWVSHLWAGGLFFFGFFIPKPTIPTRCFFLLFIITSYGCGYSTRVLGYRWEALGDETPLCYIYIYSIHAHILVVVQQRFRLLNIDFTPMHCWDSSAATLVHALCSYYHRDVLVTMSIQ